MAQQCWNVAAGHFQCLGVLLFEQKDEPGARAPLRETLEALSDNPPSKSSRTAAS